MKLKLIIKLLTENWFAPILLTDSCLSETAVITW